MYSKAGLSPMERGPMDLLRRVFGTYFILALLVLGLGAAPLRAQVPIPANFLAQHYEVSATLDAIGQSISAVARIDFKATEASISVRVELHPNLVVREENSPVPGVRAAVINKDGAYLLLPARWFPLTNFPSNRYTATFRLNVPDTFAVAGTGKSTAPTPMAARNAVEGGRLQYTFECKSPAPHGTFVVGNLQLNPKQAEGINVSVYAPKAASANAGDFAFE